MKVTKRVIGIANQIAQNAEKQRKLNRQLNAELEKMGVNMDTEEHREAIACLECDCDAQSFIEYLEYDL